MISIISPAKSLNQDAISSDVPLIEAPYSSKTTQLAAELKKLSAHEIGKLMKISDKLAELNFKRYQEFIEASKKQSLFMFDGDVYTHIRRNDYTRQEHDFAANHLRILSGLYGLLHPYQAIAPYRLEMGTKFAVAGSKNITSYWQEYITSNLNKLLTKQETNYIINLASKEYSSAIIRKDLKGTIIDIEFLENRRGLFKNIALNSKRARGMMVDFIITNKIDTPKELLDFSYGGYGYIAELSSSSKLVFCRS